MTDADLPQMTNRHALVSFSGLSAFVVLLTFENKFDSFLAATAASLLYSSCPFLQEREKRLNLALCRCRLFCCRLWNLSRDARFSHSLLFSLPDFSRQKDWGLIRYQKVSSCWHEQCSPGLNGCKSVLNKNSHCLFLKQMSNAAT